MSTFITNLRTTLLSVIDTVNIINGHISIFKWDKSTAKILKVMLKESFITKNELLQRIDQRLRKLGRSMYVQHMESTYLPDHTSMPDTFAYALKNGEFNEQEKKRIVYGDNDSEEKFIEDYLPNNTLREEVLKKLLSGDE